METTGTTVDKIIDRFVGDVTGLIRRIEVESLSGALSQASTRLREELPGKATQTEKKETKRRATTPKPGTSSATADKGGATKKKSISSASSKDVVAETAVPKKRSRSANSPVNTIAAGDEPHGVVVGKKPRPSKKATATPEGKKKPSSEKGSADLASRDAAVLEAIRVLGEPDAATVAKHVGRSKTACYMSAQRLLDDGKLVKTTSGRTILYRLASSGGVRPTKRAKAVNAEPSSGPGAKTDAAVGRASRSMPRAFAEADECAGTTAA